MGFYVTRTVTPTIAAAAFSAQDTLSSITTVTGAVSKSGGSARLHSLTLIDQADQTAVIDVVFFNQTATIPAINAAWSLDDSELVKVLGVVSVAAADYDDHVNGKTATIQDVGLMLDAADGSKDVFLALVNRTTTPTYAAVDDISLVLGLEQNN